MTATPELTKTARYLDELLRVLTSTQSLGDVLAEFGTFAPHLKMPDGRPMIYTAESLAVVAEVGSSCGGVGVLDPISGSVSIYSLVDPETIQTTQTAAGSCEMAFNDEIGPVAQLELGRILQQLQRLRSWVQWCAEDEDGRRRGAPSPYLGIELLPHCLSMRYAGAEQQLSPAHFKVLWVLVVDQRGEPIHSKVLSDQTKVASLDAVQKALNRDILGPLGLKMRSSEQKFWVERG